MNRYTFQPASYNRANPLSIFEYSRNLIGESLRSLLGDDAVKHLYKGKGGLGQMVEELFFGYAANSSPDADFKDAGVELKCTPLLKKSDNSLRIKERLVCTMIDFFDVAETPFEKSHLLAKCRLMLLLFYLHEYGKESTEFAFLYSVLWQIPEKDLLLIKQDYELIAGKIRRGEAHLLSEGDTLYLGACRKGQKGEALQSQPYSGIKAKKRAFSLKPAYTRFILEQVEKSGNDYFTNYSLPAPSPVSLVDIDELHNRNFEDIIIRRFAPYIGKDFTEICSMLGITPYQAKSKYADIASLIASSGKAKRISQTEEFLKSGIILKTVRLSANGMPKESMSFKNIDYFEIAGNDSWIESELYEIFTSRFMFVVFKPVKGERIEIINSHTNQTSSEQRYVLDKIFFWTMPPDDLKIARCFWENIRENVLANQIEARYFWNLKHHRCFHVRPKAAIASDRVPNPNGGNTYKYCYWINADYLKNIINSVEAPQEL